MLWYHESKFVVVVAIVRVHKTKISTSSWGRLFNEAYCIYWGKMQGKRPVTETKVQELLTPFICRPRKQKKKIVCPEITHDVIDCIQNFVDRIVIESYKY